MSSGRRDIGNYFRLLDFACAAAPRAPGREDPKSGSSSHRRSRTAAYGLPDRPDDSRVVDRFATEVTGAPNSLRADGDGCREASSDERQSPCSSLFRSSYAIPSGGYAGHPPVWPALLTRANGSFGRATLSSDRQPPLAAQHGDSARRSRGPDLTDVLLDPGTRDADQRPLDVIPELPRLCLHGPVTADGSSTSASLSLACPKRSSDCTSQHHSADERGAEKHQLRPFSELLAPVRGGVDPVFQFPQVRTQVFAGTVNMRFYFVGCFIHSRFSLTDSTVRSGMG